MKVSFFSLLYLIFSSVGIAEVVVKDGTIYLTGQLHQDQFGEFQKAIEGNPQIKEIVIQQCLGGTVASAELFSKQIEKRALATVAKGQVGSACAFVFLAGNRRRFADEVGANFVVFHGARSKDSKEPAHSSTAFLIRFLDERTDGKLDPKIQKLISESWKPNSGIVFLSWNYYLFKRNQTLYCDGSEGGNLSQCNEIANSDPYKNGILTAP